jgi:DNA methylase
MEDRRVVCNDLNPLAYVLSAAKVDPPSWDAANAFLDDIEREFKASRHTDPDVSEDIRMVYHNHTLKQICFVREYLLSTEITGWTREKLMIGGALAGIMHGSWRRDNTSQYLSISMPNTFSMSPSYVKKFILEKGLTKLDQDVFECLRDKLARLYLDDTNGIAGRAHHADAAALLAGRCMRPESVDLIVTWPPYLQVVNYGTANWIRLWLLGVEEVGRDQGVGRKKLDAALDHRHTYSSYLQFILRTVQGVQRVLKQDGVAVLVIGDVKDPTKEEALPLAARLWENIKAQTDLRLIEIVQDDLPAQNKVSRSWGDTKGHATNRDCALVLSRTGGDPDLSRTEIDWDEPYRDGGPDAAHERLRKLRAAS